VERLRQRREAITASVSQSASPSHMATTKGKASRQPHAITRATRAATLGPGEPAASSSAPAKISRAERSIFDSPPTVGSRQHPGRHNDPAPRACACHA
jgi:hypothetical protein